MTAIATQLPRCGDTVLHRPTGEEWIVAYAEGDYLAWAGWPNGLAKLADCDLVAVCTEEEHVEWVTRWAQKESGGDGRAQKVRRLYGTMKETPT